jgi:hypothetical protein
MKTKAQGIHYSFSQYEILKCSQFDKIETLRI